MGYVRGNSTSATLSLSLSLCALGTAEGPEREIERESVCV